MGPCSHHGSPVNDWAIKLVVCPRDGYSALTSAMNWSAGFNREHCPPANLPEKALALIAVDR
jgi:hypothetical protein